MGISQSRGFLFWNYKHYPLEKLTICRSELLIGMLVNSFFFFAPGWVFGWGLGTGDWEGKGQSQVKWGQVLSCRLGIFVVI